jgi:hypothetical protein
VTLDSDNDKDNNNGTIITASYDVAHTTSPRVNGSLTISKENQPAYPTPFSRDSSQYDGVELESTGDARSVVVGTGCTVDEDGDGVLRAPEERRMSEQRAALEWEMYVLKGNY